MHGIELQSDKNTHRNTSDAIRMLFTTCCDNNELENWSYARFLRFIGWFCGRFDNVWGLWWSSWWQMYSKELLSNHKSNQIVIEKLSNMKIGIVHSESFEKNWTKLFLLFQARANLVIIFQVSSWVPWDSKLMFTSIWYLSKEE